MFSNDYKKFTFMDISILTQKTALNSLIQIQKNGIFIPLKLFPIHIVNHFTFKKLLPFIYKNQFSNP